MDPATLAAIAAVTAFVRDAGLVGGVLIVIFALATGRGYTKRQHDDALAAKDDVIAAERARTREATRQRDAWRKAAEESTVAVSRLVAGVDRLSTSVDTLATRVEHVASQVDTNGARIEAIGAEIRAGKP